MLSDSLRKFPNRVQPAIFFVQVARFSVSCTMAKKNPLEKGKKLLEYWTGKSIHHIDIG